MATKLSASRLRDGDDKQNTLKSPSNVHAVSDRLKATEDALRMAKLQLAEQEKREKELRKLLVSCGMKDDEKDHRPIPQPVVDPNVDAKMTALKTIHEQKVRSLLRSINHLQEQIETLKSHDKEHRRSALIQDLRKSQREQELLIDILKQVLVEKVPEFQASKEMVNDYIIKKSVGGPLRFHPKTREELENELDILDEKYKRAVENLKKAKQAATVKSEQGRKEYSDDEKKETDEPIRDIKKQEQTSWEQSLHFDSGKEEEIERLKVEVASKQMTIQSQADEIHELYQELDRLRVVDDVIERKKEKILALEEKISHLQQDNIQLLHEKEQEIEKYTQIQDEIAFLKSSRLEDLQSSDQHKFEQQELLQSLRMRELELQTQIEEQQKKWAFDRTNVHQQVRLLEKEQQVMETQLKQMQDEKNTMSKRYDRLYVENESIKVQLSELSQLKEKMLLQIQELEEKIKDQQKDAEEQHACQSQTTRESIQSLQEKLDEKDELIKKLDRQLTASKLLARQSKKENEQLQNRILKLQEDGQRHAQ